MSKKTTGMDNGIASFMRNFSGAAPAAQGRAGAGRKAEPESGSRFHSRRGRPSAGESEQRDEIITTMHVDAAQYEHVRDLAYENRVSIKEMWYRLIAAGLESYGRRAHS